MTEEDFYELKFSNRANKEEIAKLSVMFLDLLSEVKEIAGVLSVNVQFDQMAAQIARSENVNMTQAAQIGEVVGTLKAISEVLAKSSDKGIAEAAKSIVFNVSGGGVSNAVNFNQEVDRANINSGSGTQHN
jgi:hypothetical protein